MTRKIQPACRTPPPPPPPSFPPRNGTISSPSRTLTAAACATASCGNSAKTTGSPSTPSPATAGLQRSDAEDAVQSFFLATGDAGFFQKADQEKGKFRTFLLTAFTRLLSTRTTYNNAQKRGGTLPHLSIDSDQAEAWLLADPRATSEDATLTFERHWAKNIIRSVLAALEAEASLTPKSAQRFQIISRFLTPENCLDYTTHQAATELGIHFATCEKAIQRLRRQFRQAVRHEIASTLKDPTDAAITEEMIQLQKSLIDP